MFDYRERIRQLRTAFGNKHIDAFVTSFLPHLRYLTGFTGSNGLCIVTASRVFFVTDFRYKEQIRSEVACSRSFITSGSLLEKAAEHDILLGCHNVGFEKDYLTYSEYRELRKVFKSLHSVSTRDLVESLSSAKEETEISLLRRACGITDRVFEEMLTVVKEGVSELDLSAEISYLHKKYGAEKDAFEPIVVSGVRTSLPHGKPTHKKIRRGDLVTLDLGCSFKGYCSDLTRTIAVGKPSGEVRRVYSVVLDAQRLAIGGARSGISGKELDRVAREHIASEGYGSKFGHGLGHGIGLQVHERPRLSKRSGDTLISGNVITVEPGIYLPGRFGVRIEDDVVIREGKCDVLTKSPRGLIIL